jgi:hypothetical protein
VTPVRNLLLNPGPLVAHVKKGLGALKSVDKKHVEPTLRPRFADSLDLDSALLAEHPDENRWDYLLGDDETDTVVALEPHSAKSDEVSTVIRKKQQASLQLRTHLKPGRGVARWFWVASGTVQFPNVDKVEKRLAEHGITFIGPVLKKKHLL